MAAPPIVERHLPHFHRRAPLKESVRAATTANITIATALNNGDALDGVTLATDDRVLVKDQTAPAENGLYVVGATPVRAYDQSTDDPSFGFLVYVREGTANARTLWENTNTSAPTIGSTGLTFVAATSSAGSALAWFVPTAATETALNTAIAAWNAAGKGTLYIPAGTYTCAAALTTITASGVVMGDGMGAYDGSAYVTAILSTSATANLFTVTGKTVLFRDLGLFNTNAGTPSAGAGIEVSGAFIGQKVDLDSIVVSGFYRNVDRQVGSQWVNRNVWNWGAVLDGERIQNTVNQDAGDWAIEGCNYYADTDNPTALVHQIGAGGGKIIGTKFNGHSGATATNSILVAMPTGVQTSVLTVSGCSLENMSGDAILVTTTGTALFGLISITGTEFGLYSNNAGRIVKISAASTGGIGVNGGIGGVVLDGLTARTDGTARAAIELVNTDRVTLGDIALITFNARYTSSGDTNTTDGGATGTVTSVALTVPAEFSISGSPVTTSGTLAITKANESANTVWAGPTSGAAAAPAFRALVAADIPASIGQTDHLHIGNITYSGDGATTAFELPAAPFDAYSVGAYVAGVRLDVTLSGMLLTTMTFASAPASGTDNIVVDLVAAAA